MPSFDQKRACNGTNQCVSKQRLQQGKFPCIYKGQPKLSRFATALWIPLLGKCQVPLNNGTGPHRGRGSRADKAPRRLEPPLSGIESSGERRGRKLERLPRSPPDDKEKAVVRDLGSPEIIRARPDR
ncbi:hypothetical protein T02_9047 [Trichinella nativa]|uniref:Uncharacterized protein n=1 Tax=Trichinella nativa TaxID=6335 RepID=A0A0V1KZ28_9BILA|nr:hypothetical protein T02_9047 [Trichinella nativa]